MFKNKWVKILITVVAVGLIMLGMVWMDVVSRAKSAYLKGEKAYAEENYKDALMWYETVIDLFQPPKSKWVRKAEAKIPECKQLLGKSLATN